MDALAAMLGQAWALLEEGAADPGSAWRVLALANVTEAGGPGVRSVVLRGVSREERVAVVHTDVRSPKVAAFACDPRAALLGWDSGQRVQVRLDGVIEMAGAAETRGAWAALGEGSRATYAGVLPPGTPMAVSDAVAREPDPGVFCVLRLHVEAIEVLSLAHGKHRRARFAWLSGALAATWLAP